MDMTPEGSPGRSPERVISSPTRPKKKKLRKRKKSPNVLPKDKIQSIEIHK